MGKVAATSAASDAGAKTQAVGNNVEDLIKEAATKLGAPAHWKLEDVKDDTLGLIKHLLGKASAELSVKNNSANPEDVVNQASGGAPRRGNYLARGVTTGCAKIPPKLLLQPFVLVDFLLPAFPRFSQESYIFQS